MFLLAEHPKLVPQPVPYRKKPARDKLANVRTDTDSSQTTDDTLIKHKVHYHQRVIALSRVTKLLTSALGFENPVALQQKVDAGTDYITTNLGWPKWHMKNLI